MAEVITGFEPDTLLQRAAERSGLVDHADDRCRPGLEQFCSALNTEARLSEQGRRVVSEDIVEILVNRLRVQRDLDQHPEIARESIADPLIITGLPRTGTTKLHQMIAQDPGVLKLPYWMATNPARFPGHDESGGDPRIAVAEERLNLTATYTPEVLSARPPLPVARS